MSGYRQAEQDLLFGVLDALPCPAALLNREGQSAYINERGETCGLDKCDMAALPAVKACLRGEERPPGWVSLIESETGAPTGLTGLAEIYPVRVGDTKLGALFMLRPDVARSDGYDALPYESAVMGQFRERLSRLSLMGVPALFLGEEGSGRAAFARALHEMGPRPQDPFVLVSCRGDGEQALDDALFGDITHPGALRGFSGTVCLERLDALSPALQSKLLALLQNRSFPDGIPLLVRLSALGPPDLESMTADGRFDAGLYARLALMPLRLPALRERGEDILPLARHFLQQYAPLADTQINGFSREAEQLLLSYSWPGNVKALDDAVLTAVGQCTGHFIEPEHLPIERDTALSDLHKLRQGFSRQRIEEALALHGHTVDGKRRAAKELGIGLSTLYRLMSDKNQKIGGRI
ncbi:MAG: sigma 54-interacting transcriptional regulator [Oscillospiraceae bacterium]|jgi:DNA-binding NtrC family response regulator|nr:sigma 54-interacting transcriptional regulator [Oscillospiraceae bacterium]